MNGTPDPGLNGGFAWGGVAEAEAAAGSVLGKIGGLLEGGEAFFDGVHADDGEDAE